MKWITGFDSVNGQNCMILNFGWLAENSLPQLVTNIDNDQGSNDMSDQESNRYGTGFTCNFRSRIVMKF